MALPKYASWSKGPTTMPVGGGMSRMRRHGSEWERDAWPAPDSGIPTQSRNHLCKQVLECLVAGAGPQRLHRHLPARLMPPSGTHRRVGSDLDLAKLAVAEEPTERNLVAGQLGRGDLQRPARGRSGCCRSEVEHLLKVEAWSK